MVFYNFSARHAKRLGARQNYGKGYNHLFETINTHNYFCSLNSFMLMKSYNNKRGAIKPTRTSFLL